MTIIHGGSFALSFTLASTAFQSNATIPKQFTCQGQNVSPQLTWKNVPANTQSFALIMNDPDAPGGNWVHWIVFNIPSNFTSLAENVSLPIEAVSGLNSWSKSSYGGPCPLNGQHRYFFRLYALDTVLQLDATAQFADMMDAMRGHVLGEAVLMGLYHKI